MEIKHTHDKKGGRFYISEPDESVTELVYKLADLQKMIIEHTEVSEQHEGKGIGRKLVDAAITYARQEQMKVLPMCPFAKAIMEKNTAYHDVLASYS